MSRFIDKYKKVINIISPYLLVGYFILTYVPYFVGRFSPLMNFFGSYDIFYRGVLSLIFILITLSQYILSDNRRIGTLFLFGLMCLYFVLGSLCVPQSLIVRHIFPNSHAIVDVFLQVGFKDIVVGLLNSFFDLYFCFYLLVFGLSSLNKKAIRILLYFAFLTSAIESLLTFVLDYSSYLSLFKFDFDNVYDLNISGTFQSKNGLGLLLFQGVLSSFALFKMSTKKWQRLIIVFGLIVIMIVLLLSFCKTSAIISSFACLAFVLSLMFKKRTKVVQSVILLSIIAIFIVSFALIMFVPQLTSVKGIGGIILSIKNTVLERIKIWYEATFLMDAPQLFIGYSKGVSGYLLHLVDETLSSYYFHNGFVTILVNYGLIGLIAYIIMVSKIYKRHKYLDNGWQKVFKLIFWTSMAYTCFEAYHLFLSGSPVVMLQSVLIIYLPVLYGDYLERRKNNKYVISEKKYYILYI